MLKFRQINDDDEAAIEEVSHLATEIVREHFDPIIGKAQNDYMIERFQSVPAIRTQIADGYQYYILDKDDEKGIGFLAFYPRGDELYLSKFYLRKDCRGRGYAHDMMAFIKEKAVSHGLSSITLNVNRNNDAIAAYEKLGFVKVREEKKDIGNGFVMDDFVYARSIR